MSKKAPAKAAKKKAAPKKAKTVKTKTVKAKPAKKAAPKAAVKKAAPAKKTKAAAAKPVRPALLNALIEGLEERKAKNITLLNLSKIGNRSFDYFLIADTDSRTHVESIAASAEEEAKKRTGERPFHTEGWQNGEWILLDYVNVVVHVFQRPVREFYNLEGLWADAEVQQIN